MRSRGLRLVLVGGLVVVGSVAVEGCSLNPQPEPPGSDESVGTSAGGSPTGSAGKGGSGAAVGGAAGVSAGTGGGSAGSSTGGKAGTGGAAGKAGTGGASGGAAGKGGGPPGGSGGGAGAAGGNQSGGAGAAAGTGGGSAGTAGGSGKAGSGGSSAGAGGGSGGKSGSAGAGGAIGGAGGGAGSGGASAGSGGASAGSGGGAGAGGASGAGGAGAGGASGAGGAGAGGASGAGGAGAGGAAGAGGGAVCDAIAQSGCVTPATKCSLAAPASGTTACFTPSGTAAKGEACTIATDGGGAEVPGDDTCAAGLVCSGLGNGAFDPGAAPPAPRVCRELCSVTHPCGTDEVCADVTGQGVGLCVPTCTRFDDGTCSAGTCAALGIDVADDASTPSTLAQPICRRAGTVADGDACASTGDCVAGTVCTTQSVCRALCDATHACATGTCTPLDLVAPLDGVGVCQ